MKLLSHNRYRMFMKRVLLLIVACVRLLCRNTCQPVFRLLVSFLALIIFLCEISYTRAVLVVDDVYHR